MFRKTVKDNIKLSYEDLTEIRFVGVTKYTLQVVFQLHLKPVET